MRSDQELKQKYLELIFIADKLYVQAISCYPPDKLPEKNKKDLAKANAIYKSVDPIRKQLYKRKLI
jgi:hypothetical protein